ncbi:hypothetical protein [Bradyrhizobium sp.]|uniref:hypothetical protein n=1 Tax=Bradyrhizobium sp. TaxID=376 RepID=UPI0025BA1FA1|nr:hypothetical protein [Bradyrhizobium sp.]
MVWGDHVGDGGRDLKPNSEWRMELRESASAPQFRIRLVAETLVLPFAYLCRSLIAEFVVLI